MPHTNEQHRNSVRSRFDRALAGEIVDRPIYAAYDWYVENRDLDWASLFDQGLGRINHADVVSVQRPNVEIIETTEEVDGEIRKDIRWITDVGELHEWWLGEWNQQHLLREPNDYRIMRRALEGTRYSAISEPFDRSEAKLGDRGITLGHLGWKPLRRTAVMDLQAEWAGIERIAIDLFDEVPELMELLELMDELLLAKCREAVKAPPRYIKLWENLSIETVGRKQFQRRLVPLYEQIIEMFGAADKRLLVHFDGKLRPITEEIAALDFDIDSLTGPPEGDLEFADARAAWPEKFLWLTPTEECFRGGRETVFRRIQQMAQEAGPFRYCFMISEEIPPDWQQNIPTVLEALDSMPLTTR